MKLLGWILAIVLVLATAFFWQANNYQMRQLIRRHEQALKDYRRQTAEQVDRNNRRIEDLKEAIASSEQKLKEMNEDKLGQELGAREAELHAVIQETIAARQELGNAQFYWSEIQKIRR